MCLIFISSTFLFNNLQAQNLIQNGSFENIANVDCYGGFYNGTLPNAHVLDYWYQYNSPDYFNPVCGAGGYSVPTNIFGYATAKHGNSYIGIYIYKNGSENKEYIYQQLSSPLQAGIIYCLNFYISRADRIPFAVKNMGAYFSNTLPSLIGGQYINTIPQVENQSSFLTDTISWTKIEGCFMAQGGEQYIIIGNFNTNTNTDTLRIQSVDPLTGTGNDISYYYIDDITLIDQSTVGFNELINGASTEVYPNPANEVINFKFSDPNAKRKIELYNTIGELVLSEDAITQNSSLKTHHLQSGIYFYHILVGEKTIKTDKIVIIK